MVVITANYIWSYVKMVAIATRGKFVGAPTRNAVFSRSGGGGGGTYIEKKKPIVRVMKVKYDKKKKKDINISIKEKEI